MKVIEPGLLTTVQDLGRVGFQNDGVSPGGAMDRFAIRVANLLVGNRQDAAGLELTLRGPTLAFEEDALIAVCGADLTPAIADLPLPGWQAIYVERGAVLSFGNRASVCRAYLAVAGGIDVPEVLGSRSTYVSAGIGGMHGRPLARGDRLPLGKRSEGAARVMADAAAELRPIPFALTPLSIPRDVYGFYGSEPVRFIKGPDFGSLSEVNRRLFVSEEFEITAQSDRMGYRLGGHKLGSAASADLLSTGVVMGTVQLPPGGEPIVLMAERQTTGGYRIVGVVATVDLPVVAQLAPGDSIRFTETTIEEARVALLRRERTLEQAIAGLAS